MDPRTGKGLGLGLTVPLGGYRPVLGIDRQQPGAPMRYLVEHAIALAQLCRDPSLAREALGGAPTPCAARVPLAASWADPSGPVEVGRTAMAMQLQKQLCQAPGERLCVGFALGAAGVLGGRRFTAPRELVAHALRLAGAPPNADCQLAWGLRALAEVGGQPYDYARRVATGPPTPDRQLAGWAWLGSAAAVRAALAGGYGVVVGYRWHARDHLVVTRALGPDKAARARGRLHAIPLLGELRDRGPVVGWQVQAATQWSDAQGAVRLLAHYGRALPNPWLPADRLDAWLDTGEAEAVALTHWAAPLAQRTWARDLHA